MLICYTTIITLMVRRLSIYCPPCIPQEYIVISYNHHAHHMMLDLTLGPNIVV